MNELTLNDITEISADDLEEYLDTQLSNVEIPIYFIDKKFPRWIPKNPKTNLVCVSKKWIQESYQYKIQEFLPPEIKYGFLSCYPNIKFHISLFYNLDVNIYWHTYNDKYQAEMASYYKKEESKPNPNFINYDPRIKRLIKNIRYYDNDKPHGNCYSFSKNGKLIEFATYNHGILDGKHFLLNENTIELKYYKEGNLIKEIIFEDNLIKYYKDIKNTKTWDIKNNVYIKNDDFFEYNPEKHYKENEIWITQIPK